MTRKTTPAEAEAARHVLWSQGEEGGYRPGSFTEKLIELWGRADLLNQFRLSTAFPEIGMALTVYQDKGAEGLQAFIEHEHL